MPFDKVSFSAFNEAFSLVSALLLLVNDVICVARDPAALSCAAFAYPALYPLE